MESAEFLILRTDITAQMALIDSVHENLEARAVGFDENDIRQMESVAYQIHNIYNAVEDLLRLVATHFENQIGDAARWHSALLQRMLQPVPGLRPALLAKDTYLLLDALRGFRHFFRHAYTSTIEAAQLQINLTKARQAQQLLHRDVDNFLAQLQPD